MRLGFRGLRGSRGGLGLGFWVSFLVQLFIPLARYSFNLESQGAMAYPSGRSWIRHLSGIRLFAPAHLLCVSRRISSWVAADCCWRLHLTPLVRSSWILSVPNVPMVVVKRAVDEQNLEVGCDHVTKTRSLTQHQWGLPKAVFLRILGLTSEPPARAGELSWLLLLLLLVYVSLCYLISTPLFQIWHYGISSPAPVGSVYGPSPSTSLSTLCDRGAVNFGPCAHRRSRPARWITE